MLRDTHKCVNCEYFIQVPDQLVGACVRYPPTTFPVGSTPRAGIVDPKNPQAGMHIITHQAFPHVTVNDWCGEFRAKLDQNWSPPDARA